MAGSVIDEIKREVEQNPVLIYIKGTVDQPMCGFSAAALEILQSYTVPFKAVDVLADPEKWHALQSFSNWPTMPQIFIGGRFVGGFDMLIELHAKGRIGPLLEAAGATR